MNNKATKEFHGTPGRPSYRKYHPSGRNARSRGLTRLPSGAMIGSSRFTEEEHSRALNRYTRNGFRRMNSYLRDGPEGMSESDLELVRPRVSALTDLIEIQDPTTSTTTLYRGMGGQNLQLNEGDEFHDRAFVSTSKQSEVAEEFAEEDGTIFTIRVPAGAQILDVNAAGDDDEEGEVLLPPGSKFRVSRVVDTGGPSTPARYEVEVINA